MLLNILFWTSSSSQVNLVGLIQSRTTCTLIFQLGYKELESMYKYIAFDLRHKHTFGFYWVIENQNLINHLNFNNWFETELDMCERGQERTELVIIDVILYLNYV